MQVVLKLSQNAAETLHGLRPSPEGEQLRAMVAHLGLRLEPMHPGASEPSMRQYFTTHFADKTAASNVVAQLQQNPSVEAAYVKPGDELP